MQELYEEIQVITCEEGARLGGVEGRGSYTARTKLVKSKGDCKK